MVPHKAANFAGLQQFGFCAAVQARVPLPVSRTREPLNQSDAVLSGFFAPIYWFENLEIRKGFLQFSNLNLEQNPSLTTLSIESELP